MVKIIKIILTCEACRNYGKKLNSKTFLFGMLPLKDASIPYNSILMTVKYYIYKSKCFNNVPDMFGLLNDMNNIYITSKIISIKNGRYHWFETNWNTWSFLEDC